MDKNFNVIEYKEKILNVIKQKNGLVTIGDVALVTNYPVIHIKYILNILASEFTAVVDVQNGDLVYKFNLNKKSNQSFKQLLSIFGKSLYKLFVILFKIAIMLILFGYFIFYIPVVLYIKISSKIRTPMNAIWYKLYDKLYDLFFNYITNAKNSVYVGDDDKRFYMKIFSFVFGDDVKEEIFNNETNLLYYLKFNKVITIGKAVNLSGLTEEETKKMLLDMVVKYEGNIEVNEDGIIYYIFDNLTFSSNAKEGITYCWERIKPIPYLNLNTTEENKRIAGLNLYNLIISSYFLFFFSQNLRSWSDVAIFFAFKFPFVFSFVFYLVPLIRRINLTFVIKKVEFHNLLIKKIKELNSIVTENKETIIINKNEEKMNKYLLTNYQNLLKKDFIDGNEVINIKNYKNDVIFYK